MPYYVGQTTKKFINECFTIDKQNKYHAALCEYTKGIPVMFFVSHPLKKGKINASEIDDIEDFMIQLGVARNEDLLNIKGTKKANWSIAGVIRGGKGKSTKAAKSFKKMMGVKH